MVNGNFILRLNSHNTDVPSAVCYVLWTDIPLKFQNHYRLVFGPKTQMLMVSNKNYKQHVMYDSEP